MYPDTGRKNTRVRDFKRKQNHIVYELKKGREGGRKERMKREEGKKRMPLENAPIIAWDFPCALQSHFHCRIETGIKV